MASSNKLRSCPFCFIVFVLLIQAYLLLPVPVHCENEGEKKLFQGLNSYRTSQKLSSLSKNKPAGCLADELADEIKDNPCVPTVAANAVPGGNAKSKYPKYQKLLKKCSIDPKTTLASVILPVCVPKLVPTLVLTNYTMTGFSRYINDSRYTEAGVGSEDDWIVVVLTTSAAGGSFVSNNVVVDVVYGFINFLMPLLAGVFLAY